MQMLAWLHWNFLWRRDIAISNPIFGRRNWAEELPQWIGVKEDNSIRPSDSSKFIELSNNRNHFWYNYSFEATSRLFISFKENHFLALNRTEAYTITDFIASCGGLLGLFMGISLLSVVELIYFFTLRLCCKIRKQKTAKVEASMWAERKNVAKFKHVPVKRLY